MTISTILSAIKRALGRDHNTPVMDHVPVQRMKPKRDWRDRALLDAAKKYGKPFKCAAQGLDREIMVTPDTFAAVKGDSPLPGKPWATVTKIKTIAKGKS